MVDGFISGKIGKWRERTVLGHVDTDLRYEFVVPLLSAPNRRWIFDQEYLRTFNSYTEKINKVPLLLFAMWAVGGNPSNIPYRFGPTTRKRFLEIQGRVGPELEP